MDAPNLRIDKIFYGRLGEIKHLLNLTIVDGRTNSLGGGKEQRAVHRSWGGGEIK
jgi:hypothetical protein